MSPGCKPLVVYMWDRVLLDSLGPKWQQGTLLPCPSSHVR